jgi:hypothetical protein
MRPSDTEPFAQATTPTAAAFPAFLKAVDGEQRHQPGISLMRAWKRVAVLRPDLLRAMNNCGAVEFVNDAHGPNTAVHR